MVLFAVFLTMSVTVYVPGMLYVVDGFCTLENCPLPKSHVQELGLPVERSLKLTGNGPQPETTFAEKSATRACAFSCKLNTKPMQQMRSRGFQVNGKV